MKDLRFSLLPMPFMMGFHFGPGTHFTDGSKLYPDPRRREVGWGGLLGHSRSPIAHRSMRTSHTQQCCGASD